MSELRDILLVEDNEGDIELTRRALRKSLPQCRVEVAHDGGEAMKLLTESCEAGAWRPQLILLDINMPRVDGKSFLRSVKASGRDRAIPVVMFTSSESAQDVRECYELYASGYVVKPFEGQLYNARLHDIVAYWNDISRLPPAASPRP